MTKEVIRLSESRHGILIVFCSLGVDCKGLPYGLTAIIPYYTQSFVVLRHDSRISFLAPKLFQLVDLT